MRACEGCTLCCKVMGVKQIDKPRGTACRHIRAGHGCAIHPMRPGECRAFTCRFQVDRELDERWWPSACGLVVNLDRRRVVVNVDADRPDAWRREPFYSTIKRWSGTALPGWPVFVSTGEEVIAVYPDREVKVQARAPI